MKFLEENIPFLPQSTPISKSVPLQKYVPLLLTSSQALPFLIDVGNHKLRVCFLYHRSSHFILHRVQNVRRHDIDSIDPLQTEAEGNDRLQEGKVIWQSR